MRRSRRALTFLARERGLLTGALKTFETVLFDRPYRIGREIANRFPLNTLRTRARARKFEIRPVRGGGYGNLGNYPPFLKKNGLYFSQGIVWDKQHPVLTRKDFMGAFEIAFYGWKEGGAHLYLGPNNATDLWHVKKVNPQSMVHLTEKPVELAVRAIQYSSREGDNVLDLFGGSGSTLIACEQTGRKALLLELDAPYCDVIVARWEQFTGKKSERANGVVSLATNS